MSNTANRIMFLDLETQNHPYYGAVASPRHPENYVVMNGYAFDQGPVQCDHYLSREASLENGWLHIPDDVWLIVAHNAPYEMDWFLVQQRPEFQKFLQRGGRVWCTAYAEYLLSHQQKTYPSLDETAPDYGGTHKVDGIKILWEQGVLTADIDPELLREYLAGPGGDVENTRRIFYGQWAKMTANGMLNMALDRMEGMLFCAFAVDAGLYVDRDIAFQQLAKQEADLALLKASTSVYREHIPEYVKFNTGSDFHMSAWLFGGPIKYVGKVQWLNDDGTPKFVKADFVKVQGTGELLRLPDDENEHDDAIAKHDWDHLGKLERYKAGKNKGTVKVFREDTDELKYKNADLLFQCPPLVDLSLFPNDIRKAFEKEFAGKRTLADESPVYSTGKDCLDMLAVRQELSPEVRKVLEDLKAFYKLDKDIGTYYLREEHDDDGNVTKQSGMLQYLTDKSIVHHVLNCTSTVTSRLSSNRPNMQNIPRGDTSDVKKMFTSRYDDPLWLAFALKCGLIDQAFHDECSNNIAAGIPNGAIVEADYSALEVVTLAAFSKDANLVKALTDGIDMHCMRLAQQLGEPYADVLKKCKDENHPDHAEYHSMRTAIKPKAFAYQYGATAQGIAFATGCTVEDAQAFIDAEKALFPEVESFYEDVITPAVMANTGQFREQGDDGSWHIYGRGHWQAPGGTCYSFRQHPKTEWTEGRKAVYMAYKPTQIRNYPIQGESGFFVQGVCGRVVRWLIACNFFGGRVHVINTVHDAIYLDCHLSVLDTVAAGVQQIMEGLPQYFNAAHGYDLQVPFPAAVEFGRSMHEKVHWKPGVLNDPKVREKLGLPALAEAVSA